MSAFEILPAIDLLGGKAVRLAQGDYARATVYGDDPAKIAGEFADAGTTRLHVVDLDGAKAGQPVNGDAVRAILAAARVPVQLGGGLRDLAAIERALALGIDRAILGTAALRDPELVREASRRFPGRIAIGIDARGGRVAVSGWLETSDVSVAQLAALFEDAGVAALIYTDIARDGMRSGPDLAGSVAVAAATTLPVIASGGVGSIDDVRQAASHAREGLAGLIVGRALYTGDVDLREALEVARCC